MQLKSDPHIFSGMQRDMAISKHKAESLWDAHNIRFTARDGDTLLSITNEKGTREVTLDNVLHGIYLGHCVINNYVIVFTTDLQAEDPDYIYKVTDTNVDELYNGDLGFSIDHPIETLGIYENDDIQKVYWTDGLKQPRYIICSQYGINKIRRGDNDQFNFISTLKLDEEVEVTRYEGRGVFAPGTIQYAFSYYNKYGKQSNIFYTTLLNYIAYPDRGGRPDERVANCFRIKITKLQTNFDYLRVYSIHRTSLNAVPTVKRVIDIDLSEIDVVNNYKSTSFIDDGQIGDIVDPTELLYVGGEEIVCQTLTQKDNTLFFGNLNIIRPSIDNNYKEAICAIGKTQAQVDAVLNITEGLQEYSLTSFDISNDYYKYANTLNGGLPGFKNREHYRLGVQFQHKSGKWSEPVFIGDYTLDGIDGNNLPNNPALYITKQGEDYTATLYEPKLTLTLATNINGNKIDSSYIKVRPVVVFPTIEDRLVLTQGVLCPTVFSKSGRSNSNPFSQSSWFFRPFLPKGTSDTIPDRLTESSPGVYAAYRHLEPLFNGGILSNNGQPTVKSIEIQGSYSAIEETTSGSNTTISVIETPEDKQFFVDQSILTMHSPDIEWDDQFNFLNYTDWKLKIVGATPIHSVCSDISIQTTSPQNLDAKGFIKNRYNTNDSWLAGGCFISGLLWEDYLVTRETDDINVNYYMYGEKTNDASLGVKYNYLVYPWSANGSLNNDEARGDNGTRTATLKEKRLSNLKFSLNTKFFNFSQSTFKGNYDISQLQLFNSDQVVLTKIPLKNKNTNGADINYYGNIDTLLSGNLANIIISSNEDATNWEFLSNNTYVTNGGITPYKKDNILYSTNTPVRMKYKSGKHIVFSLTPNADKSVNILPRTPNVPSDASGTTERGNYGVSNMFWTDKRYIDTVTSASDTTQSVMIFDDYRAMDVLKDIYPVGPSGYVILLNGGSDGSQTSIGPTLGQVSIVDGDYVVTNVTTQANTYYIGTYYLHTMKEGPIRCFTKRSGAMSYLLEESNIPDINITEDGNTIYPFTIKQEVITGSDNILNNAYLLMGELYREPLYNWDDTDYPYFSGNTDEAAKSNLWIPAGKAVKLNHEQSSVVVEFTQGDTWYTRYDCLKTYPFTNEDQNQIIEIASFLCESRINGDGRYDRNRGQMSNLTMSPTNFNLLNPVYSNHDNFFNYRILDEDYYKLNNFSNQITWSKEKQMASDVDTWTNVTLANTFDLDGTMGPINSLQTWSDTIYCFQNKAISIISFNPRVQIPVTDGVPIEISNSGKLEGKIYISTNIGCENKQTIAVTPSGIYFVDPNSRELYNVAGKELKDISTSHGFNDWFKNTEIDKTFYDSNRNDLYVVNSTECLTYSEILGQFTSFMDYNGTPAMFNIKDKFFAFRNEDYINNNVRYGRVSIYELFAGDYNTFFKQTSVPFWIEFVSNADAALDKIFSTIELRLDYFNKNKTVSDNITSFDKIRVYNEYQDTSIKTISWDRVVPSSIKRKFRIWRINIPRDRTNKLDRIRNTWAKILLRQSNPGNKKMVLHDLSVQYFV